jgi:hypothetical protein
LNTSFAASRKSVSGNTTSVASLKPKPPLLSGLSGTTPNARTRPSSIEARRQSRALQPQLVA